MILNVGLILTLIWPLGGRGLALSTALVAAAQCATTCWLLQRRIGSLVWHEIARTAWKTTLAVVAMSAICVCLNQATFSGDTLLVRAGRAIVPLVVGVCAFFAVAWLLQLREPWLLLPTNARLESNENAEPP